LARGHHEGRIFTWPGAAIDADCIEHAHDSDVVVVARRVKADCNNAKPAIWFIRSV
jgi:hypothetical protein